MNNEQDILKELLFTPKEELIKMILRLQCKVNTVKEYIYELSDNTDDTTCYDIDHNCKDDIMKILEEENK